LKLYEVNEVLNQSISVSDGEIRSIVSNHKKVQAGDLFVAIKGTHFDGHSVVDEVLRKKPLGIVTEKKIEVDIPQWIVPSSRKALAELASHFFGNPSQYVKMIGITGTSGKTTTSFLIRSLLNQLGLKTGLIGTIEIDDGKEIISSELTTPGPLELHRLLKQMKENGCEAVVMEVSSHALDQYRVGSVCFDEVVFLNLSPEHLDYHLNLNSYFDAKKKLFTEWMEFSKQKKKFPHASICIDSSYGRRLVQSQKASRYSTFGEFDADLCYGEFEFSEKGIKGKIGNSTFHSPLLGRFNAQNLCSVLSVGRGLGVSDEQMAEVIPRLDGVPGRLQRIAMESGPTVIVDYAHKPDALEKVLELINELSSGKVITVFGCGGDRDREKRPLMGAVAEKFSDQVWVTSDNPRTEDPDVIIQEILNGMQEGKAVVQPDRFLAIRGALLSAKKGDWVLIAGKGHEKVQKGRDPLNPEKVLEVSFDDVQISHEILKDILKGSS
tara:strand:+ start:472 stop:1953 length:1482 start_codon:yes stop_codon:yes gene_type:complete